MSIMLLSGKYYGFVESYLIEKFTGNDHYSYIASQWYQCERTNEDLKSNISQTVLDLQQLNIDSYNGKYGDNEEADDFEYPASESSKLNDLEIIKALRSINYQIETDYCDMNSYGNVEALDMLDRMIGKLSSTIVTLLPEYQKCKGHDIC